MSLLDPSRKETVHLWSAIAILLLLTVYRILAALIGLTFASDPTALMPMPEWFSNVIGLALILLLWTAYRRWMGTIHHRRELELVIRGIGPDMLMTITPDRRITMCNEAVEAVFGYTVKEVVGQTTDFLYFDRRITGEKREIFNRLQQIGFHTGFAKGRRKDGRIIPLEITTGELPRQPGAVLLIRDITERKQVEDQLIEAKERAEATAVELRSLEQMRDNLTHMIVHDLKSPLTALSGYLELLKRYGADRLEAKQASFLDEAMNLTRRLADMINSLLDVRRLESNEMPLNKEVCDLKELAGEALGVLGLDITERRVSTEAPPEPVIAFCDRGLIRRVFVNLVGNAAKFTPRDGAIAIKLESMGGTARVAIVDNGTGIPREYHEKIFERFGQLEAKEFSTGLGLTFCKLAVEAHGGRIGLESEPGKGSTFWFELSHAPTR